MLAKEAKSTKTEVRLNFVVPSEVLSFDIFFSIEIEILLSGIL